MTDFARDWRALEEAQSWITAAGYRLVAARGPEGMRQGWHLYCGDCVAIRVVADRGQWFVDVRPDPDHPDVFSSKDWFSLEAWGACLGIAASFHADSDKWSTILASSWRLAPQLEWLEANLIAIESAAARERAAETRACLADAQRALSPFPPRKGGSARGRARR